MKSWLPSCLLWSVFFLSSVVFVYSAFNWGVYTSSPRLLLLYFVIPTILCFGIIGVKRQSREFQSTVAASFLSLAISLYGLEFVLIFLLPRYTLIPALLSGSRYDLRSKLDVVLSLRAEGEDAHPDIYPTYLRTLGLVDSGAEVLPLGKIPHSISVDGNESGEFAVYRTDEFGFRNPAGLFRPDHVGVLIVGDSFVQGSCVRSGEELAAKLRSKFPESVSLGSGGNGPLLMLGSLKEYGEFLRPRNVIWGFYEGNDFKNLKVEAGDSLLLKYLDPEFSQRLVERQPQINAILRSITATDALLRQNSEERSKLWRKGLKLFHLRGLLGARADAVSENRATPATRILFRRTLLRAKELTESWGGKFYFLYIPQHVRFADPHLASHDRDFVLGVMRELQIPVIDGLLAFQQLSDPLSMFQFRAPRAHLNAAGYDLLASQIINALETESE